MNLHVLSQDYQALLKKEKNLNSSAIYRRMDVLEIYCSGEGTHDVTDFRGRTLGQNYHFGSSTSGFLTRPRPPCGLVLEIRAIIWFILLVTLHIGGKDG